MLYKKFLFPQAEFSNTGRAFATYHKFFEKRYFRRSLASVKIVGAGLGACDVERRDAGGFDGDDSVLVLQDPFNH